MAPNPAETPRAAVANDGPPTDLPPVEPPSAGFIIQLFVIPAIIVAVVVVVWLLFGKLAGGERDAMSYVETMKSPGANWRAAYELASLIKNDPKLARDPRLLGELARLLDQDLRLKADPDLLKFLAASLGAFQTLDAVGESGEKVDVIGVLARALDPAQPDPVRAEAATSLASHAARLDGKLDDPRAVKALAETRTSDNEALRTYAAFALGFFGGADSAAALKAMLDDPARDVRYNAAAALARRGDMAAAGNLKEMLSEKDLGTLLASLSDSERSNRMELIETNALQALAAAVASGKLDLPRSLRGQVETLTRSGLVAVRSQARELLKGLPEGH
jgi:HEAT repeat protein